MARGFVIYFSGRTGSTFLVKRLAQHPNIDARGEVLGAPKLYGTLDQTADNQSEFIEKFYAPYAPGRPEHPKARGFKIQIWVNKTQIADEERFADLLRGKDVVHIHMIRRNTVKQLVSAQRASGLQSREGTPHLTPEMQQNNIEVPMLNLDATTLFEKLEAIEGAEARIKEFISRFSDTATVYYEDLLSDKAGFLNAFCEMVRVEPFVFDQEEELVKMTPGDLSAALANFDEIKAALSGTRWETQLLEGVTDRPAR